MKNHSKSISAAGESCYLCSRGIAFATLLLLVGVACSRVWADSTPTVRYTLSLAHAATHQLDVRVSIPPGVNEREMQLPVWNALYQVRDFAQYINWVKATNNAGHVLDVQKSDKSQWVIRGAADGAEVEYEIFTDQPGPYDAQLNLNHAFFNLAEVLMYPIDARGAAVRLRFTDIPSNWRIATTLSKDGEGYAARNYDALVDSPVELGLFEESDFAAGAGHYRVVVDADRADYDMQKLVSMIRRIVTAGTEWMNDCPFDTYMFLYHFPREASFGGMEHANSTAISLNAQAVKDDVQRLSDVSAHEFFHAWNVKRIRPRTLEPVDYTKENYTRALWFSEGVTSTVQDILLLRANLLDERRFLDRLADQIQTLEGRPAHRTQSAEQSSLEAWLEKYSYYRLPQRSISYYNKGDLLGVLLDLELRDKTHGTVSLRELMQWMNQNYARAGRYFSDSEGVREAAEAVTHAEFSGFFDKYVAGTEEIPWNDFFQTVGLTLAKQTITVADLGFQAARSFDKPPRVTRVEVNSEAERAGLTMNETLLEINGHLADADFESHLNVIQPGDTVRLKVRGLRGERELHWKVGGRQQIVYQLKDLDHTTRAQKSRRAAWLKGEAEGAPQQ
ncbi:MAG TPA: hypothetical protein VH437_05555 [Terriglobales bacterium]|jgi:predicted metalloprotease with PDZ domain